MPEVTEGAREENWLPEELNLYFDEDLNDEHRYFTLKAQKHVFARSPNYLVVHAINRDIVDPDSSSVWWIIDATTRVAAFGNNPTWGFFMDKLKGKELPHAQYRRVRELHFDVDEMGTFARSVYDAAMELWPRCELCTQWRCYDANDHERHEACESCDQLVHETLIDHLTVQDGNCNGLEDVISLCGDCVDGRHEDGTYFMCMATDSSILNGEPTEYYGDTYCDSCWSDRFFYCSSCCDPHRHEYGHVDEYGDWWCMDCAEEERLIGVIHDWDYRPDLNFHPSTPTNPKKPLYIGMELEVSFGNYSASKIRQTCNNWIPQLDSDLIYVKHDSSVNNGFEIVTHPMEPRWALKNFPFTKFQMLIDDYDAIPDHRSCGTHIHMNKEAFTTSHLWKFMQLHFRLPDFLRLLGGRGDGTYASFGHSDMQLQRERLMNIAKKKDQAHSYERYVAVNLRNEYTIELRYPAGGVDPHSIRKNIELALALYEFSDFLSVRDVKGQALDDPGYLMWWIKEGNYPDLRKWMDARTPTVKPLAERSTL